MSYLFMLDEVVQNLEHHPSKDRIKKIIFLACNKEWSSDKSALNSLDLQKLIVQLRELNPTLAHLKYKLYGWVVRINKINEYLLVAETISKEMEKLYPPYQQPKSPVLSPEDSTGYLVQATPKHKEKLFVLELNAGKEELGVEATLEIIEANDEMPLRVVSWLPSAKEIIEKYENWKSIYGSLLINPKVELTAIKNTNGDLHESILESFESTQSLRVILIKWYNSEEFNIIKEKLAEQIDNYERIKIIIRTQNPRLWQIPWNLVFEPFLNRYRKAEIVMTIPKYTALSAGVTPNKQVKVLSIVANPGVAQGETIENGIDSLPDSEISLLTSPKREEINNELWEQGWNILFFSSYKSNPSETDRIYINETENLTMWALKYALTKAIVRGLKLAIFNFGDGLALAQELASLQIPQIIVMREPLPDMVAQEFLKLFLKAFSGGKSLYAAVREARERLHHLEKVFPSITWSPVICENCEAAPLTWQDLRLPPKTFPSRLR